IATALPLPENTMSLTPSPLKSPVPAMLQLPTGSDPNPLADFSVPLLFISQTPTPPTVVLYQRMSDMPSPSKSPVPATVQSIGHEPIPTGEPIVPLLFMYQIATAIPLPRNSMSPIAAPLHSP